MINEPKNWLERVQAAGIPVYGDPTFRGPCNLEDADLIYFFSDIKHDYPELKGIAFHVKNEGNRTPSQVKREKMKGALVTGLIDVVILGGPVFVMELKRKDYTICNLEPDQFDCLVDSKNNGAFACVCLGIDAAREALAAWLEVVRKNSEAGKTS